MNGSGEGGFLARRTAGAAGGPGRLLIVVTQARWFLLHRAGTAAAAMAAGWDVHVATPASDDSPQIAAHGFTWHELPLSRTGLAPGGEVALLARLLRLYRRTRPTLVHHVGWKPILYGTLAARWLGIAGVVNAVSGLGHLFATDDRRSRLVRGVMLLLVRLLGRHRNQRFVFQNADDLVALAGRCGIPPGQALCIGAGVDLEHFHPAPRPEGPVTVVLAARMLRTKGVLDFVAAARLLRDRGVDVRCVLAGTPDDPNPATLRHDELAALAAEGVVEYWGGRDDMPAVFAAAHVACLPTYYREGVPTVLLEAAACGLPVVATATVGCRDAVRHGVTGLLVPLRDPVRLADALATLARDPGLRDAMGRAGRELVEREYDLVHLNGRMLDLYAEVAAASPAGPPAASTVAASAAAATVPAPAGRQLT